MRRLDKIFFLATSQAKQMLLRAVAMDSIAASILFLLVVASVVYVGIKKGDAADLNGAVALSILSAGLMLSVSIVKAAQMFKSA